jgi:hypothetical protein
MVNLKYKVILCPLPPSTVNQSLTRIVDYLRSIQSRSNEAGKRGFSGGKGKIHSGSVT